MRVIIVFATLDSGSSSSAGDSGPGFEICNVTAEITPNSDVLNCSRIDGNIELSAAVGDVDIATYFPKLTHVQGDLRVLSSTNLNSLTATGVQSFSGNIIVQV